jgi:hypothetical protein
MVAAKTNKNADTRVLRPQRCQNQAPEKSAAKAQHKQRMGNIRFQKTLGRAARAPMTPKKIPKYRQNEATSVPTITKNRRVNCMWFPVCCLLYRREQV